MRDRPVYTVSVVTVCAVSVVGEPVAVRLTAACSAASVYCHHCPYPAAVVTETAVGHSVVAARSAAEVTAHGPSVAEKETKCIQMTLTQSFFP